MKPEHAAFMSNAAALTSPKRRRSMAAQVGTTSSGVMVE